MGVTDAFRNLKSIYVNSSILPYEKNQILLHANDIPSGVYFLRKGIVKKTAILENGREITLRIYKEGSFFPLVWAFTDKDSHFYRAVTEVEVQKVPRKEFISFLRHNPDTLFELTKQILASEYELFTNITHQLSGDSYHRVVAALILYAKRFEEKKLPLTHQEIADITGLTRETVSVAMLKLKKKKIISSKGIGITIKNFDALLNESTMNGEEELA